MASCLAILSNKESIMQQAKASKVRRDYWVKDEMDGYLTVDTKRIVITAWTAHSALIQAKDRFGQHVRVEACNSSVAGAR
jgi:hypothetical protein